MNSSRYNVVTGGPNGETLVLNAATGAFAALSGKARERFLAGECPDRALVEQGFFTEQNPSEELRAQQEAFQQARTNTDELAITIAPTYACNFKCPYCYEAHHSTSKRKMPPEVLDSIYDLVTSTYEKQPYGTLVIEWYGGDPSLCLDIVRDFSARLIAFCDENCIAYDAIMLTNCNLIDEAAVQLLKNARVNDVLVTLDGLEEEHNKRRVSATGSNSFERNLEAIRLLTAAGIHVSVNSNIDKVNIKDLPRLRKFMRDEFGAEVSTEQLNDYGHFFGEGGFAYPDFDLFTHEEYAHAIHDEQKASGLLTADYLRAILRPVPSFCRGQQENYYVFDALGDVYNCDGWMGDKRHCLYNIADDPSVIEAHRADITLDATHDTKCSNCELLPICQGSCSWERRCNDDYPCHPLKETIGDYLRDWRECFGELEGEVNILAPRV